MSASIEVCVARKDVMSPCIGMHYPLKGHVELGVEVHKF